jgi:hypothetical protein
LYSKYKTTSAKNVSLQDKLTSAKGKLELYYLPHIIPPHDENAFSEFKKDIVVRTIAMEGGTISNHRNTRRSKNNKKNKNTRKNKNQKKLSEMSGLEHFRARMRIPIGTSSFGIPLTPEMIADGERIAREYHV